MIFNANNLTSKDTDKV